MKFNLKNTALSLVALGLLSACGSSDDDSAGTVNEQITTDTPVIQYLDILETDENFEIDLLQGLNSSTPMFVTSFGDTVLNEDGSVNTDINAVPYIRQLGEGTPKHVVFDRAQAGVELTGSKLTVKPFVWTDKLANEEIDYFLFEYHVDNGYDNGNADFNDDLFTRRLILKVTGVEDKVEDITFDHETGLKANPGFETQLLWDIMPANATFPTLTFSSSDTAVATIDSNGVITGVAVGNFTITATSADGLISKTIDGEVVKLVDPIDMELRVADVKVDQTDVNVAASKQLQAVFLPEGADFENVPTVEWMSTDTSKLTVDANGMITGVFYDIENTNNVNTVDVQATIITTTETIVKTMTVDITPHATDYMYSLNPDFESGKFGYSDDKPFWTQYWENKDKSSIEVSMDAGKDGGYGLKLVSSVNKAGINMPKEYWPQIVGEEAGRKFKFSYDVKFAKFDDGTSPELAHTMVTSDWPSNLRAWQRIDNNDWNRVEIVVTSKDWGELKGSLSLFVQGPTSNYEVYFDNFMLEEVFD